MSRPLPLEVRGPYSDETVTSILMLHTEARGYPRTDWTTDLCGAPLPDLLREVGALERLATKLNLDPSDLCRRAHLAAGSDGRRVNFFGHTIDVGHLDRSPLRVCPKCIGETKYLKAIWSLTLCRVCPVHAGLLIESCPSCGAALNLNFPELGTCHACKYDYTRHDGDDGDFPNSAAFWKLLQHKIDETGLECKPSMDLALGNFPLPSQLDLAAVLQGVRSSGPQASTMARALEAFSKMRDRRFAEDQEWSLALLNEWPQKFDAHCDDVLRLASRQTELMERAIHALHPILSWSLPVEAERLRVRALERVTARRCTLLKSFRGAGFIEGDERRCLLVHEVDALLGIREAATRELFEVKSFDPGKSNGSTRKRLIVVDAAPVNDVIKDIATHGNACSPEREYLSFEEASLALQAFNARRRTLLNGMRCGDIDFFFEDGKQPTLGTARIAYDSLIDFLKEALRLDLQQWVPFRLAAILAALDPRTLEHLQAKRRLVVRGEAGLPDTRAVLLHSLLQFKETSRTVVRLGAAARVGRHRLAGIAQRLGLRLQAGPGVGGSIAIVRSDDVAAILAAIDT